MAEGTAIGEVAISLVFEVLVSFRDNFPCSCSKFCWCTLLLSVVPLPSPLPLSPTICFNVSHCLIELPVDISGDAEFLEDKGWLEFSVSVRS